MQRIVERLRRRPRAPRRNPKGRWNKGLGRRRPPLAMRQHRVATTS
jgi:hypothetical protein